MDELRWPTMFEYDGMKWHREQAAEQAAKATSQLSRLQAMQQRQRAAAAAPKTFGGLMAQAVGKAAMEMLKDTQEAWLSDAGSAAPKNKNLSMNLVSPVPRTA